MRRLLLGLAALLSIQTLAFAQQSPPSDAKPEMRQPGCIGFISERSPLFRPVAFRTVALERDEVRINYVGHSTFLIESPGHIRIATDYNDYMRPMVIPDIVTMNHAHTTHYTDRPDPAIKHVLRGWRDDGKPAGIDVTYQDVHIRSVTTNIRDWSGGTQKNGNSIFVFEIGSLCIAHLGHLHHTLTQQQLDEIGRVDVVMVPVDGSYTLDLDGMVEVLQSLKAPLMIPMHYFSYGTLERFLERVRDKYAIERNETPSVIVSRATLPATPKFLVLPGR
jgi:L-ascorbate metabolism protein UlaG (beta-lactamase superfamily)